MSIGELRALLAGPDGDLRDRAFGRMLREARDVDVWAFTTPNEVARMLPRVARRVGQRLPFWTFLIEGWRADGLLASSAHDDAALPTAP